MALVKTLSQYWLRIQSSLFPWLEEELGELTEKEQKLVTTLDLVRVERFIGCSRSLRGRPPKERAAVARAFVAKAVHNMPTTRALLDRLESDKKLRRICGWEQKGEVPSEATFSRAFAEFSESQLPACVHQAMIAIDICRSDIDDTIRLTIPIILDDASVALGPWSGYHVLAQDQIIF